MAKKKWCLTSVKRGDIIHTCSGYNKKVRKVEDDGTVVTTDGHNCDLYHCCSEPKTRDEIVDYFLNGWGSREGMKYAQEIWSYDHEIFKIVAALKARKKVFDNNGLLIRSDLRDTKKH